MKRVWNVLGRTGVGVGAAVAGLIVTAVACAPQAADQSAELAAMSDRWEQALNAGDIDGVVGLYTEDCLLMPPNTEMERGHAAVRSSFGEMIDAGLAGELETVTAVAAGNVGYHAGTYTIQTPDGTVIDRGKFVEGWQKTGGEWKIASDIWNSDWPAGTGTTTIAIIHDVEDADHWLAAWQGEHNRRDLFSRHGVANVRVFQNSEKPTQVGLLVDVSDMEAFEAMLSSQEGAAAKAEDGVIDAGMVVFTEVK